jgi:hypothetical protein
VIFRLWARPRAVACSVCDDSLASERWSTSSPLAGTRILTIRPDPELLQPWNGPGVMAGSITAVLAAAFAAFRKRDV